MTHSTSMFGWLAFAAVLVAPQPCQARAAIVASQAPAQGGCELVQKLMKQIDGDLAEIDKLLLVAGSEKDAPSGKEAAKAAHAKQKDAADAMQKILEHVHEAQQSSGGS